MTTFEVDQPILNSPYEEPEWRYEVAHDMNRIPELLDMHAREFAHV
jgi:hypothetical protein